MKFLSFFLGLLLLTSSTNSATKPVNDPYQDVVHVTNTTTWPYDKSTYGNATFIPGGPENEDTKILHQVQKQGFHFPNSFAFGVASSAYQYEGHRVKPNIGWSIWDVFSEKFSWLNPQGNNIAAIPPTSLYTIASGQNAIKGYDPAYYKQDIQLAQSLGVKFYRISISWPRLFPRPGMTQPDPAGVQYYTDVLKALKKAHLTPFITLYHWDLPAWLYNFGDNTIKAEAKTYGWLDVREAKNNLILKEFQKYVAASYEAFGSYTPYFSTFNEPLTFTNSAFTDGVHAPGQYGWQQLQKLDASTYGTNFNEYLERVPYLQAINVIKAHYIGYKTIHHLYEKNPQKYVESPQVSIVLNSDWAEPYRITCNKNKICSYHADDIQASKNNMDFMLGWWLNPVMFGTWPESMRSIYQDRIKKTGLQKERESSCLQDDGVPVTCGNNARLKLADYISQGGALDLLALNHYTGYFAVASSYAKSHFSLKPSVTAVPPDQYNNSPGALKKGWTTDQNAFITQFRYIPGDTKHVYIIGRSGNRPWLRQTWFAYRKLLQYVNRYYLHSTHPGSPNITKSSIPFSKLTIYLTENGTSIEKEIQNNSVKDTNRIQYLLGNLGAVQQAVNQDGINVKLYTYWSIADNFEWSEGYDSRFGLVWIDYANDYKRIPKASYYCFKEIIHKNKCAF